MINFPDFETSQIESQNTIPFVLSIPQRYLHDTTYDLSARNKVDKPQDLIPTTLPAYSEKESILLMREGLLKKRAEVFDCWFFSLRKSKNNEIKLIDKQLDQLEIQLISMQKDERENMLAHTKKIMSNADALLLRINS